MKRRKKHSGNAGTMVLKVFKDYKWAVPGIGTLAVLVHFWRIAYLPTLSISDLGLIAAAIILLSTVVVVVVAVIFCMPGMALVAWSQQGVFPPVTQRKAQTGKAVADAAGDTPQSGKPAAPTNVPAPPSPSPSSAETKPMAPEVWGLIWLAAGLLVAPFLYWLATLLPEAASDTAIAILFAFSLMMTFVLSLFLAEIPGLRHSMLHAKWRHGVHLLLTTFLYCAALPFISVMLSVFGAPDVTRDIPSLLLPMLLVAVTHWLIYATHKLPWSARLAVTGILLLYTLCIAGVPFRALDTAVQTFKLGLMPNQTLLVTEKGCAIAEAAQIGAACKPVRDKTGTFQLGPVYLVTRLGDRVLVAKQACGSERRCPRAPIPASEVVTWFDTPADDGGAAGGAKKVAPIQSESPQERDTTAATSPYQRPGHKCHP